jgi:hypothetical protein
MARVIHDDLVATLGEEAIAYGTVTESFRKAQTGRDGAMPLSEEISPYIDDSDEAILSALEELLFLSVRQLSRATHLQATTVYRRLSEKLEFTARHLRWMPQILSDDGNATRIQGSKSLLTLLPAQDTRDWHDVVTLDESWFYYITDHELMWLPREGNVTDRECVAVQSKK